MHVDADHVKELVEIITRHGQLGKFGFHLLHRHDPIASDTIRLESDLRVVPGKWNKATSTESLDLSNIHPLVIKFVPDQNRFVPFEFGEGPSPVSSSDVDDKFGLDHVTFNFCVVDWFNQEQFSNCYCHTFSV
ncbi:hypothetical protein VC83_06979 [Pseudogymnoascus destructans]|nr:uncharacterized protein VC83_06979 [Pseudogymnoascus destructans]OAF56826.2 hypothetical protein VC83_06979 [Pseudogymnoascus destructans]